MTSTNSNISDAAKALLARIPEPPLGTVIIDGDGKAWQRGTLGWYAACFWRKPFTWLDILVDYGIACVFDDSARISDQAADEAAQVND